MCGIAGILMFNGHAVTSSQLKVMTDSLAHRGPDGEGVWLNDSNSLGLGHRRLSIIDLSDKAAQPMHYLSRYSIVFNGEIYNYIEMRDELRKNGYSFTSQSDTEVLLAAYDKYGTDMLRYLNGMFAFAIWDEKDKVLFCARDRFGEKPFYFFYNKNSYFAFASEMKALFKAGIQRLINRHMLYEFLVHHTEENPFNHTETFFDNIFSLEASHYLLIKQDGTFQKHNYWRLQPIVNEIITFDEAADRFRELFELSIRRCLRSDVPVGSSLSGGLDSSSVVCALDKLRKKNDYSQNTFSARFYDSSKDEGKYMKMVIDATSVHPHDVWVDDEVLINEFDKICYYQEEPFGSASILAQWKVMQLAKQENVTVLLDGQGADETLAGYTHFFDPFFKELYLTDSKLLKKELGDYKNLRGEDFIINTRFKMDALMPHVMQLPGILKRRLITGQYCKFMSKEYLYDYKNERLPFSSFRSLNESLNYYTINYGLGRLLRFADRNAMAHSREVRLPFLFHELVEFIFTLPATFKIHEGWTKYLLRKSMGDILPPDIAWRISKLGYEPPQMTWLKQPRIIERIEASKKLLIKEKVINPQYAYLADDWVCLVTAATLLNG